MDSKQLISVFSNLPIKQQKEIAIQILHGLKSSVPNIEQAWMDEVERRARKVDSEEVEMIPGDQAVQRLESITLGLWSRIQEAVPMNQQVWLPRIDRQAQSTVNYLNYSSNE